MVRQCITSTCSCGHDMSCLHGVRFKNKLSMEGFLVGGISMVRTQQQRSKTNSKVTHRPRDTNIRAKNPWRPTWFPWGVPLLAISLVIVGLAAWWGIRSVTETTANDAGTIRSIATLKSSDFHSLLVDPQDPEHILFGSHTGVQESRDGGFTWNVGSLRNADAMQLASSSNAPGTVYATGHDVFQVSRDGGQTWQPLANNLPGTDIHGFAQDPATPQRLYAFVMGAGLFTSADSGAAWQLLPAQPPGGGMHLALASSATALYAATGAGIMTSSDQGMTWRPLAAQPSGQVISLAIPASDPQTLYVGTSSGLAKSTDAGASWTALGPQGVPILAIAVTPTDPGRVLLLSDKGAIYRSNDGGTTWQSPGA